ncbi:IclR family transcriptional regulator [Haloarchaeobius sp. HME9146]|uniref:IclR family transcriptional regulator n=1 Tax=Haloarchaeobius sp. HME9146 TaxID=2978732 RepID=UPI0021C18BB5|nr:IclR family transcriptional regulator [Haloarchaeobius sp. HME9146]MCT9098094.1 IclR family transcriptional regulator [Haloarchaeobius sp. HME9146]
MKPRRTEGGLQTTAISLRLVELLVELEGATLGRLAEEADLAKSTVHNHLSTLSQYGYVTREQNTYHVGLKHYHIGDYARKRNDAFGIAKELVPELADETQLEVDFTVEENGRIVSLYDESTYSATPSYLVDGRLFHVHSTASGKAILSEYADERVRDIINRWGLPQQTDNTITSVEALLTELDTVREQGYATNHEEAIEGMWAVSQIVTGPNGEVAGSLNVCGPTYVYSEEREAEIVDALSEKVEAFENRLADMYPSGERR